jgi:hypothetical protein
VPTVYEAHPFAARRRPSGHAHEGPIQNGPRRLRSIKGLQWQTLVRGDIGRQRLFRPLANPGEVRALMRYEVKQHDFKMFEGDS